MTKTEKCIIVVNCFATICIAVFTYLLWDSTNKLWRETYKNSELSNKTFKLSYRPYINIEEINRTILDNGEKIQLAFVMKNNGNIIGKIIKFEYLNDNKELLKSIDRTHILFPQGNVTRRDEIIVSEDKISAIGSNAFTAIKRGATANFWFKIYYQDELNNEFVNEINFSLNITKTNELIADIVDSKAN